MSVNSAWTEAGRVIPAIEEADADGVAAEPPRRLRFALIPEAWALVNAERTTWTLIALINAIVLVSMHFLVQRLLAQFGISATSSSHTPFSPIPDLSPHRAVGIIVSSLVKVPINAFFAAGVYRTAFKQIRGGKINVGDLFQGWDRFGPIMALELLYFVFVYGFSVYVYFPGALLVGVLYLTFPIVADRRAGPIEAARMSLSLLKGQAFTSFVFAITVTLASLLGLLGCGVGILFTLPIGYVVPVLVYRDFFGLQILPTAQIEMPYPPREFDISPDFVNGPVEP